MKKWLPFLGIALGLMVWGAGCEDGGGHGEGTGETPDAKVSAQDVSGTWTGKAGTAQGPTTLRLSQNGRSLSGSWVWGAGDTRTCRGYKEGDLVVLRDDEPDGDSWAMSVSADGRQMSGEAEKYGGGTYALSFAR